MAFYEKMKKVHKFFIDNDYRFLVLTGLGLKGNMSNEEFLKRMYQIKMNQELVLENPILYTEKLQWLKLYDQRPEYTVMVDKYEVKKYVANKIGSEYVIPLLGVWENAEDIDFDLLPEKFVLKTTHDSGSYVVCKNKCELDILATRKRMEKFLRRKYYNHNREWPYKNVKPRVIAETYMEDSVYGELRDYKFFTFAGKPKVLYIAQGRGSGNETVADFFDMDFNHLPFTIDHNMADVPPEKPLNFELMKKLAEKLSEGTPQLRVDFYEVNGKVYFGEMTFFHCSGMAPFHPVEWNRIFGEWVSLPPKNIEDISCID